MYICPNCNATSETAAKFCTVCGTGMVESVPAEPVVAEQPAYEVAPEAPVAAAEPVVVEQPAYEAPAQPAYQAPAQPAYQAPVQPQYQAPVQPQYQAPVQPQYQAPQQPAYQAPVQPQYQPQYQAPVQPQYQPQYQVSQQPEEPSKAKSIVGMVLAIVGAFFAFIVFIITISALEAGYYGSSMSVAGFVYGCIALPLSIVGFALSKGNDNGFGKTGKIVGLIALITSSVELFVNFINMID